ncbi:glycosyltransferase family 4 protein [Candidatus Peregrinibacteria bacterium]|nr:glycosyltransferase family 4 protein [Candidatus Peregrinibacteria bacterium]
MRVLFYTDTPNVGGAEKQMALLAKHLKRLGVRVSLAYGGYSQLEERDFAPFCECVYSLPVIHKHDPRHYHRLKEILCKDGLFDLLHIHLWNPGACQYAFFAAAHAGIPIVTTEHDPFELRGIKQWIKKSCLQKTAHAIAVSSDNYKFLNHYYHIPENHLHLIHNGIDVERFAGTVNSRDKACLVPTEDGVPADAIVVTCIAELHPRKGHEYLLRAFEHLEMAAPRVHLFLVGKGPLEASLRRRYGQHPNIHFLGWRDDIPELLKASDIVILPSLKEAFGMVLVEAMASGVAVIGTNRGGIPDIVQDGVTGLLVPPANSEKIVEAIYTLIQNPDLKRDMGKKALQHVREHFTAERMARETMEIYELVTSDERRATSYSSFSSLVSRRFL